MCIGKFQEALIGNIHCIGYVAQFANVTASDMQGICKVLGSIPACATNLGVNVVGALLRVLMARGPRSRILEKSC